MSDEVNQVLDPTVIETLKGELESDFAPLIGVFLSKLPERMDAIRAAGLSESWDGMRNAAHTLKGACRQMGAVRMSDWAARLERSARIRRKQEMNELVSRMDEERSLLEDALQKAISAAS